MANLLTSASQLMCPHGGTVSATSSNTKAKADGNYILRSSDTFTIAGCAFTLGSNPHPCVQVQWVQSALKSKAAGDSTLTEQSVGLCVAGDQATQGMVQVSSTQSKVAGL